MFKTSIPHCLIVATTPFAVFHTPRLVQLLQKEGMEVSIASPDGFLSEMSIFALTGKAPVHLLEDTLSYDLLILAPYAQGTHKLEWFDELLDSDIPAVLLAAISTEWEPPQIKGKQIYVVSPVSQPTSYGKLGDCPLASPEQCAEEAFTLLSQNDYAGKTLLLTAGPTIEDADPARFISNRSTGKMGCAIAQMAARRGAQVTLIHGPMQAAIPQNHHITPIPVRSAEQMLSAVDTYLPACNIAILCAAVADFMPIHYSEEKIKKGASLIFQLDMKRTPDILAHIGAQENKPFLVGFAAESNDLRQNALEKLTKKHCDMLCANDITAPGCGFAVPTNKLTIFTQTGKVNEIPLASKPIVAEQLLDFILSEENISKPARQ